MTVWGSPVPLSLDPLIKEARRRMRQRRVLIGAMALLLAGGAIGAGFALSAPPGGSAPSPSPAQLRMSPLSNLAARRAFCGNTASGCRSPDGKWSIVYVNRSPGPVSYSYSNGKVTGYDPPPVGCTLNVTNLTTGRREGIHVKAPACDHGVWLGNTYFFQDPIFGSPGRLLSIDPPSRHVKVLAEFSSDVVSPDGRWIAGEAVLPDGGPSLVAVVSTVSHTCRVVAEGRALPPGRIGFPPQGVAVYRSPWDVRPISAPNGQKDPVTWNDVVQGGTKIQVVSGPGTGFTRDSRSIIVATWKFRSHPFRKMGPIHKRLLKFDLSSLHTPCPASVAAPG